MVFVVKVVMIPKDGVTLSHLMVPMVILGIACRDGSDSSSVNTDGSVVGCSDNGDSSGGDGAVMVSLIMAVLIMVAGDTAAVVEDRQR